MLLFSLFRFKDVYVAAAPVAACVTIEKKVSRPRKNEEEKNWTELTNTHSKHFQYLLQLCWWMKGFGGRIRNFRGF